MTPIPSLPTWERRFLPSSSPFKVEKESSLSRTCPLLVCKYIMWYESMSVSCPQRGSWVRLPTPPASLPPPRTGSGALCFCLCAPPVDSAEGGTMEGPELWGEAPLQPLPWSPAPFPPGGWWVLTRGRREEGVQQGMWRGCDHHSGAVHVHSQTDQALWAFCTIWLEWKGRRHHLIESTLEANRPDSHPGSAAVPAEAFAP